MPVASGTTAAQAGPGSTSTKQPAQLPTYTANMIRGCACLDMIEASLSGGAGSGPQLLLEQHGGMCRDEISLFLEARTAPILAAVLVVLMNGVLRGLVQRCMPFLKPQSEESRLCLEFWLMFGCELTNTAVLVLFARSTASGKVHSPLAFPVHWYAFEGSQVLTILLVSMLVGHLPALVNAAVWQPLRRYCIVERELHGVLTQAELQRMLEPPELNLQSRYASMLSVFVAVLAYMAAFPALVPLGACALVLAFIAERYLMLRLYAQPKRVAQALNQWAVNIIKVGFVVHCIFAVFIFGDPLGVAGLHWYGPSVLGQRIPASAQSTPYPELAKTWSPQEFISPQQYTKLLEAASVPETSNIALLKAWSLSPSWDSWGLAARTSALATLPALLTLIVLLWQCSWSTRVCLPCRTACKHIEAQDPCSCEAPEESEDARSEGGPAPQEYVTREGRRLPVKQTAAQRRSLERTIECLSPPYAGRFVRRLPPQSIWAPRPPACARACAMTNFVLPCVGACFSAREQRLSLRWKKQKSQRARHSKNRFANRAQDSSSDGEWEDEPEAAASQRQTAQALGIATESQRATVAHFHPATVHLIPMWRPAKGHRLSKAERQRGWQIQKDTARHPAASNRVRVWANKHALQVAQEKGMAHPESRVGDAMRTWETIARYGVHSYRWADNPRLAEAQSILDDAEKHKSLPEAERDVKFEPRLTRSKRLAASACMTCASCVSGVRVCIALLVHLSHQTYIRAMGGDANAQEQQTATEDTDDEEMGASAGSVAKRGVSGVAERLEAAFGDQKQSAPEAALSSSGRQPPPPTNNYEVFLERRRRTSPRNLSKNTVLPRGFHFSTPRSTKVLPSQLRGMLAS